MLKPWWSWLLLLPALLVLTVVGYDRLQMIDWVGFTDLEINFLVTDAGTGSPIPGARIAVHSEYSYGDEEQDFSLMTGADGVAQRRCRCMCGGKESGLGFTKTFGVGIEHWLFQASAPGYEPTELLDLGDLGYGPRVQRVGPGRTKLVVPVYLRKDQP
jgi:hypothetical protein